jgi:hypothetical protein
MVSGKKAHNMHRLQRLQAVWQWKNSLAFKPVPKSFEKYGFDTKYGVVIDFFYVEQQRKRNVDRKAEVKKMMAESEVGWIHKPGRPRPNLTHSSFLQDKKRVGKKRKKKKKEKEKAKKQSEPVSQEILPPPEIHLSVPKTPMTSKKEEEVAAETSPEPIRSPDNSIVVVAPQTPIDLFDTVEKNSLDVDVEMCDNCYRTAVVGYVKHEDDDDYRMEVYKCQYHRGDIGKKNTKINGERGWKEFYWRKSDLYGHHGTYVTEEVSLNKVEDFVNFVLVPALADKAEEKRGSNRLCEGLIGIESNPGPKGIRTHKSDCWKMMFPNGYDEEEKKYIKFFEKIAAYADLDTYMPWDVFVMFLKCACNLHDRKHTETCHPWDKHHYPDLYVDFRAVDGNTLHMKGFHSYPSKHTLVKDGIVLEKPLDYEVPSDYISVTKILKKGVGFSFTLPPLYTSADDEEIEVVEIQTDGVKELYVGSEVHWSSAMDQHAPDLLKGKIQEHIDRWYSTRRTTAFALSTQQIDEVKFYLGMDLTTSCKQPTTCDHIITQVARDFCRQDLLHLAHPKEDTANVLHIGATWTDFKAWRSRESHDFLFCFKDSKDTARTVSNFTTYVTTECVIRKIAKPGFSKTVTWDSFYKVVDFYNKHLAGRRRVYVHGKHPLEKKYLKLMFSDSLYDMSEEEFLEYFHITGAVEAFSTLFMPFGFFEEMYEKSDFYVVEEYFDDSITGKFFPLFEELWPEILLATPLISDVWLRAFGENIHDSIIRLMRYLIEKGLSALKSFFEDVVYAQSVFGALFSHLLGVFKVFPIFNKIRNTLKKFLEKHFGRTNVTWKGYENGYDHKSSTWKAWAKNRVFSNGRFCVASEQISRYGEMGVWRFWLSNDASITWRYTVPDHLRQMKILDWEKSVDPVTGIPKDDLVWTSCRIDDFYKLLSWGQAEPDQSFIFEVCVAGANRVRKGLSLISYTPFRGLAVTDKEVFNFAINVYFTYMRSANLKNTLKDHAEYYVGDKFNVVKCLQTIAKATAIVATGGLAVLAWKVLHWLIDTEPNFIFVEEPPDPALHMQKARSTVMSPQLLPISVGLPAATEEVNKPCTMCEFFNSGKCGTQRAYKVKCTNEVKATTWQVTPEDAVTMKMAITNAINDHRPHVGPTQISSLEKFEKFFDGDVKYEGQCFFHYLLGGAGTGKSTWIRQFAKEKMDEGKVVAIGVPLKKLKADFVNVTLMDGTKTTFNCQTPWMMAKWTSLDVLILDESGLQDETWARAYIAYTNPSEVYIVGDHHQHDRVEIFDGRNGLLARTWWKDLEKSSHELIYNYRLDSWRVKWANLVNDTHMIAIRKDELPPEFLTIEEYQALRLQEVTEYVFAHDSSQLVFGKASTALKGPDDVNMSVYSSQGATQEVVAVSCTDIDLRNSQLKGALYVAISRAKGQTYFVCPDKFSATAIDFKVRLHLDSEERKENVAKQVWVEIPEDVPLTVSLEILNARKEFPGERISDHKGMLPHGVVVREKPVVFVKQELPTTHGWHRVFNTCTYEALPPPLRQLYLETFISRQLQKLEIQKKVFKDYDGWHFVSKEPKYNILRDAYCNWLEENKISYLLWMEEIDYMRSYKSDSEDEPLCLKLWNGHLYRTSLKDAKRVPVKKREPFEPCTVFFGKTVENLYRENGYRPLDPTKLTPDAGKLPPSLVKLSFPDVPGFHKPAFVYRTGSTYVDNEKEVAESFERPELSKAKNRIGEYDAYKQPELVEDSGGYQIVTGFESPTDLKGLLNHKRRYPTAKVNAETMLFDKTKRGRIRPKRLVTTWSAAPGHGNFFSNSPYMTFKALGRVLKPVRNKPLSVEAKTFMDEEARKTVRENHTTVPMHDCVLNRFVIAALRDGRQRNYPTRAQAEEKAFKSFFSMQATNKSIYKPVKDGKIDHLKNGQALLSGTSMFNCRFIAPMRALGGHYKATAKPHLFLDLYEAKIPFLKRLCDNIRGLPISTSCGIMDSKEYDAGQGPVTVYCEKQFNKYLGVSEVFLEDYMQIRAPNRLTCYGLLTGKTSGQKGSGLPDTLKGNSQLTEITQNSIFVTQGPKVKAVKGDDAATWSANLQINDINKRKWGTYTNLDMSWEIGKAGEFCGMMISNKGAAPALERMACKVIGKRFENKEQFYEYQISIRNDLAEVKALGLETVVCLNAISGRKSEQFYRNCLRYLTSFSHTTWDQFSSRARKFTRTRNVKIMPFLRPCLTQLS